MTITAARIPTISLKAIQVKKSSQPKVIAAGLFLIGCLFFNIWLTLGIIGALYIITLPVTWISFCKARSQYESSARG